jgi:hypothetical protein
VRPEKDRCDQELASLARETRRVADSINESAIRARLIEIADELFDLASPREKSV